MSLESLFYYRRVSEDKQGNIIVSDVWDCFHIHRIVRGVWSSEQVFTIRLDDGHEEARDVARPGKNGKTTMVKDRAWYVSQVDLCKEDADRLRKVAETTSINL